MHTTIIKLGLKENWQQFSLLVIINAFVGGMVGMERSILPKIAEAEFHIAARTAILSFIIVFGIAKAITNYFTGTLAGKLGKKNLLIIGWLLGIPVPFMLMYAQDWNWIVVANVLLGINQGLTWSSTVMMKIDLVGERKRGFAMGLNEFAGYLAVAVVAFLTGWIAGNYGLRPFPFYVGVGLSFVGLLSSWLFVKDTHAHVAHESVSSNIRRLKNIFWETSWKDRNLGSVSQAGLINNLNDGMVWGILPMLLASRNFEMEEIAIIISIYPAVWGIAQIITGRMADSFCKKDMLFWGMIIQAVALSLFLVSSTMGQFIILSVLLGWGTAMVYPTFLASIAEHTHPLDRAKSVGIFRLWRDLGYAVGALLTGIIADLFGLNASIILVGALTFASAIIIFYRMKCADMNLRKIFNWRSKNKIRRVRSDTVMYSRGYSNSLAK
jgi:MFS family permease